MVSVTLRKIQEPIMALDRTETFTLLAGERAEGEMRIRGTKNKVKLNPPE